MSIINEDNLSFIKEHYNIEGRKYCSEKLGISLSSVYLIASKLNLIKHNNNNNKINTNLFVNKINLTKESAYIIGYLWADGTLLNNSIRLSILKEDADDIKHIFDKTGQWSTYKRIRPKRREQFDFFIADKVFYNFLIENGKYPHSIESHEKIITFIGDKYIRYFLRGLIDGDGHISNILKTKCLHLVISASFNQDWSFLQETLFKYGLHCSINRRIDKKNNYRSSYLRCSCRTDIKNFIKWLYKEEDNIYLNRKFELGKLIMNLKINK